MFSPLEYIVEQFSGAQSAERQHYTFIIVPYLQLLEKKIGWGCVGSHTRWFQRETFMSCCKC